MKKFNFSQVLWILALSCLLTSCLKDDCRLSRTFYRYDPVYQSVSQLRASLKLESELELKEPGKIYVYGSLLLINEIKKGIHIYDNTDPAQPVKLNFIEIPGNVDLSVRNGILYADSYIDLLAIDINQPANPTLLCRTENVFSPIIIDPVRGLLVDYKKSEVTVSVDCKSENFNRNRFWIDDVVFDASVKPTGPKRSGNFTGLTGIGGSMARFTLIDEFLYTVDMSSLYSFDVSSKCPTLKNKNQIGWNIETIYPYDDKLFIGSTSGMFIYTLTNPAQPALAGNMNHWRSCDPVIVEGSYAYVTLHGGTACGGYTNQLDIVDVSNIYVPRLVESYTMESPLGLGIKNNRLYICDQAIKIYQLKTPTEIKLIATIPQSNPYDLIVLPDHDILIVICATGIYQYDNTDPSHLTLRSVIPVIN